MANSVSFTGTLGAAPTVRDLPGGGKHLTVTIGQTTARGTEWRQVVATGSLAETASSFAKGRSVQVQGRTQTRKWTDKDGIERYSTEIVASSIS